MRVRELDAASDRNLFLFSVVVVFLELGFFFEKQFVDHPAKPLLSELGHPQRGLGQSSIFYSDDDATDPAFKAARQVGYSGNGFGKPHRFPAAWAVWDVRIGSRGIHACLVARNRVWSFDVDQARHSKFCQRRTGRSAAPARHSACRVEPVGRERQSPRLEPDERIHADGAEQQYRPPRRRLTNKPHA
jgi:hypothetical protein